MNLKYILPVILAATVVFTFINFSDISENSVNDRSVSADINKHSAAPVEAVSPTRITPKKMTSEEISDLEEVRKLFIKIGILNDNTKFEDALNLKELNLPSDLSHEELTLLFKTLDLNTVSIFGYDGSVLSYLATQKNLKSLTLNYLKNIKNLEAISNLQHLENLDLGFSDVKEIESIGLLKNLKVLQFAPGKELPDLNFLKDMQLEQLSLQGSYAGDFSVLASLKLKSFKLAHGTPDLSVLAKINTLEQLDLSGTSYANLDVVGEIASLKQLILLQADVKDLKAISKLSELEKLDLSQAKNIKDFSFLKDLKSLKSLNLDWTNINNLEVLSELNNLKFLDLGRTKIKDLKGVESLQNLEIINFNDSDLANLSPLIGLKNLKELSLYNSKIHDLESVGKIASLQKLSLGYSDNFDLHLIKNLKNLEFLNPGNSVITEDVLNSLSSLKWYDKIFLTSEEILTLRKFDIKLRKKIPTPPDVSMLLFEWVDSKNY